VTMVIGVSTRRRLIEPTMQPVEGELLARGLSSDEGEKAFTCPVEAERAVQASAPPCRLLGTARLWQGVR
jgi:hypothetical protein